MLKIRWEGHKSLADWYVRYLIAEAGLARFCSDETGYPDLEITAPPGSIHRIDWSDLWREVGVALEVYVEDHYTIRVRAVTAHRSEDTGARIH
jgi:hypothetical protein